jgi:hypothetical protein
MGYHLAAGIAAALTAQPTSIDRGVSSMLVGVRADHTGDEVLAVQVVLKDSVGLSKPSSKLGDRLMKIAAEVRRRAAALDVPLRASVRFVAQSELAASHKSA